MDDFKKFYDDNYLRNEEIYEKVKGEIQKIRDKFPLSGWKNLTVKEYKTVGTNDSLCYLLEFELKSIFKYMPKLVSFDGGYGYKFDNNNNKYYIGNKQYGRGKKESAISEEKINDKWKKARKNVYDFLVSIGKADNYNQIKLPPEDNIIDIKVLIGLAYIFFPNKVIGIVGKDQLEHIAKMFNIDINSYKGKNSSICLNFDINKKIREIKGLERANGYIISMALWDYINKTEDNEKIKVEENTKKGENIIFYGIPGCGKSWYVKNKILKGVDEKYIERITFHPEYTYEDFIGQIMPRVTKDKKIEYKFIPGPFVNILKKAVVNKKENFYLIIEELNRGNAPAIFGDIFQLLDRDQNGDSEYSINNIEIAKEVYKDEEAKIKIPKNLTIIATMNTSDQNVFTLDTAFKRRFRFRMCENKFDGFDDDENVKYYIPDKNNKIEWTTFVDKLNGVIREQSEEEILMIPNYEDKLIGYYFVEKELLCKETNKNVTEEQSYDFASKIIMYLWNDVFKYNREEIFDYKELSECIRNFFSKGLDVFSRVVKEKIVESKVDNKGENNEE